MSRLLNTLKLLAANRDRGIVEPNSVRSSHPAALGPYLFSATFPAAVSQFSPTIQSSYEDQNED